MDKIVIMTDTDSSLPVDLAIQYGIRQVPINIHIDGNTYETGVDIYDQILFNNLDTCKTYPTTSAPSPSAFAKDFKAAILDGAQCIICICVSQKVSSSYDSAVLASHMFQHDIVVIDSQNLSMGMGFMVLMAAEAAFRGASKEEILKLIADVGQRTHTFAILPTLKYIALSGRLNKFSAGIADTFNIKPILTVQEGKLEAVSRQRTIQKAMDKMLTMAFASCDQKAIQRVAILHVNDPEGAVHLQKKVDSVVSCAHPYLLAEFTPGLSIHTGPGALGVTLLTNE